MLPPIAVSSTKKLPAAVRVVRAAPRADLARDDGVEERVGGGNAREGDEHESERGPRHGTNPIEKGGSPTRSGFVSTGWSVAGSKRRSPGSGRP